MWLDEAKKASSEANRLWVDQSASTEDMAKGGVIGLIINDNHPRALELLVWAKWQIKTQGLELKFITWLRDLEKGPPE